MAGKRALFQRFFQSVIWDSRANIEDPRVPLNDATLESLWGYDAEDKPVTLQNSLSITAFLRSVVLRSDTQASLPFNVITVDENGDKDVDKSHPAYRILNEEFNPTMGSYEGRKLLQSHADTVGNGFAEIIRNGAGDPRELWPLDPKEIRLYLKNSKLWYEVGAEYKDGTLVQTGRMIPAENMYHIKAPFSYDGYIGVPPMELAKDTLGIAIGSNSFVNRFWRNNATPSIVVTVEQTLDQEKTDNLKENWQQSYGGSNQGKFAILGRGAKVMPMTMPLDQAQLANIAKHSVIEIARLMGVPPHLLFEMERETYTNIENATSGWVRDTIRPNSVEWEQETNRKFLRPMQRQRRTHYTEHDLTHLLRGDSVAMANFFQSLHAISAISANEVRKHFNWNPIGEQGDQYMVQQGFASVDQIMEKMEAEIEQTKAETTNLSKIKSNGQNV